MVRFRVSIAVAGLFSIAIAAPASAAPGLTSIAQSAVPPAVRADFRRQFTQRGAELVGTAASPCFKGWRFRGLHGWSRRVFPLSEADRANGITRHEVYLFGARLARDTSDAGFVDASKKFYQLSDNPYATSYTVQNGKLKLLDVHTCF